MNLFHFSNSSLLFENLPYSSDKDPNDMGFVGIFQIFVRKRPYVYSEKSRSLLPKRQKLIMLFTGGDRVSMGRLGHWHVGSNCVPHFLSNKRQMFIHCLSVAIAYLPCNVPLFALLEKRLLAAIKCRR